MELWNLILFGLDICMLRIPFAYRRTSRHSGYGPLRPPGSRSPSPLFPPSLPRSFCSGYGPPYSVAMTADTIRYSGYGPLIHR